MMKHKIVDTDSIKIIGVKAKTSYVTNGKVTAQLAKQFMPRLKEIKNRKDEFTLSLQNYDAFDFKKFNPNTFFEKWIGVAVNNFDVVPEDMQTLAIHPGRFLVIDFKGSIPEFIKLWQYLHATWLPKSEFNLDNRPHFERLPKSYNPMNEVNEEEIWIPIT